VTSRRSHSTGAVGGDLHRQIAQSILAPGADDDGLAPAGKLPGDFPAMRWRRR